MAQPPPKISNETLDVLLAASSSDTPTGVAEVPDAAWDLLGPLLQVGFGDTQVAESDDIISELRRKAQAVVSLIEANSSAKELVMMAVNAAAKHELDHVDVAAKCELVRCLARGCTKAALSSRRKLKRLFEETEWIVSKLFDPWAALSSTELNSVTDALATLFQHQLQAASDANQEADVTPHIYRHAFQVFERLPNVPHAELETPPIVHLVQSVTSEPGLELGQLLGLHQELVDAKRETSYPCSQDWIEAYEAEFLDHPLTEEEALVTWSSTGVGVLTACILAFGIHKDNALSLAWTNAEVMCRGTESAVTLMSRRDSQRASLLGLKLCGALCAHTCGSASLEAPQHQAMIKLAHTVINLMGAHPEKETRKTAHAVFSRMFDWLEPKHRFEVMKDVYAQTELTPARAFLVDIMRKFCLADWGSGSPFAGTELFEFIEAVLSKPFQAFDADVYSSAAVLVHVIVLRSEAASSFSKRLLRACSRLLPQVEEQLHDQANAPAPSPTAAGAPSSFGAAPIALRGPMPTDPKALAELASVPAQVVPAKDAPFSRPPGESNQVAAAKNRMRCALLLDALHAALQPASSA